MDFSNPSSQVVPPMAPDETRTNLIINHLPSNLTEQEFHQIFAGMGTIKNYRIMKDLRTGTSFGFGFVEYDTPEAAASAILKLNNYHLQNKRLKVSYAQPPGQEDLKDTNLYIKNIPRTYTLEQLEELFSPYGTISQKLIFKDRTTGLPNGVGFVRYKLKAQAYAAIQGMNGRIPDGGSKPLLVKYANDSGKKTGKYPGPARFRGRGRGIAPNRGGGSGGGGFSQGAFNNMKSELMELLITNADGSTTEYDGTNHRWPQEEYIPAVYDHQEQDYGGY